MTYREQSNPDTSPGTGPGPTTEDALTATLSVQVTRDMMARLDELAFRLSSATNRVTRAEVVRDLLQAGLDREAVDP